MGSLTCEPANSTVASRWFGSQPSWRLPLERDAMRMYGSRVQVITSASELRYLHKGVPVSGRSGPVPVEIHFARQPAWDTYGLAPEDYPRVFADRGAASKHRMPDDSLCLYYPKDDSARRWVSSDGLLSLLDLTARHLLLEDIWRDTGGVRRGKWLGAEAAHGIQP